VRWTPDTNRLLRHLLKRAQRGWPVTLIPGNHDEWLRSMSGNSAFGITVERNLVHATADGRRFLVLHGDEADALVRTHPLIARLGSHAYDLLVTLNTVSNEIRRWLGFRPWSFSGALKRGVKRAVTYVGNFELALTTMVRDRGPRRRDLWPHPRAGHRPAAGHGLRQLRDWIEHASAIAEAEDGTLVLVEFLPEARETPEPGRSIPEYVLIDGLPAGITLHGLRLAAQSGRQRRAIQLRGPGPGLATILGYKDAAV
jgi:hypothetical protein